MMWNLFEGILDMRSLAKDMSGSCCLRKILFHVNRNLAVVKWRQLCSRFGTAFMIWRVSTYNVPEGGEKMNRKRTTSPRPIPKPSKKKKKPSKYFQRSTLSSADTGP